MLLKTIKFAQQNNRNSPYRKTNTNSEHHQYFAFRNLEKKTFWSIKVDITLNKQISTSQLYNTSNNENMQKLW